MLMTSDIDILENHQNVLEYFHRSKSQGSASRRTETNDRKHIFCHGYFMEIFIINVWES